MQNDATGAIFIQEIEYLNTTCCGANCNIIADKVDVYYWPDPLADASCLNVIGNGTSYVADGATTDSSGGLYWGCTIWGTELGFYKNQSSTIFTTATLSNVADISYKAYLVNPWDPSQCGNTSGTQSSKQNSTIRLRTVPLDPRGHSLIINDSIVSTTAFDSYTL